ncbi:MAG: hypothetical protein ACO1OB_22960 [Archangium sp.]
MRKLSLTLLVLAASCGKPDVGNPCSATDDVTCKSNAETFDCVGGTWAAVSCSGPNGCTDSAAYNCDISRATAGTACPSWAEARQACQNLPPAILLCSAGKWQQLQPCSGSCSTSRGAPECMGNNTGGGSGSTGGGSGTTGGGDGSMGGGSAMGGGSGNTGGGSGATGGGSGGNCNPSNCAGCCSNGQCFPAPLNTTNDYCGSGGNACVNCTNAGRACNTTTATCDPLPCNPSTCPNGCCANGQCFPPPLNSTSDYCGNGGSACRNCTTNGLVCNAAFTCALPNTGGGGGSSTGGGSGGTGGGSATGGGSGTERATRAIPQEVASDVVNV